MRKRVIHSLLIFVLVSIGVLLFTSCVEKGNSSTTTTNDTKEETTNSKSTNNQSENKTSEESSETKENDTSTIPVVEDVSYNITFKDYDGKILQSSSVKKGELPIFELSNPSRENDENLSYTFAGWDKEIVFATSDETYTATYDFYSSNLTFILNTNNDCYIVKGYSGHQTDIIIPSFYNGMAVTEIADSAFEKCTSLTNIEIPSSIISIGDSAFRDCESLASITIPENVKSIGEFLFSGCTSLTNIEIPSNIISIGDSAFLNCSNLKNIIIPDSVETISLSSFDGCNIETATISTLSIPYIINPFLREVNIVSGETIGQYAFRNCMNLEKVTIGDTVKIIDNRAFQDCRNLKSVIIGNNVTQIGGYAFSGCYKLTRLVIGNSVNRILNRAFEKCYKLVEIVNKSSLNLAVSDYFPANIKNIIYDELDSKLSIDDEGFITYNDGNEILLIDYIGDKNEITIPNSITKINDYALYFCKQISKVEMLEGVTSIGAYAFYECKSLTNLLIPNSVTSIGDYAFYYCNNLNIVLPNSLTYIGDHSLSGCYYLTNITIPYGVTSIGYCSFEDCKNLMSITIPSSVTSIGDYAFRSCYKLVEVINKSSMNLTKGSSENGYVACYAKQVISDKSQTRLSTDNDGFVTYNDGADIWLVNYLGDDIDIIIPSNVTKIDGFAFSGNDNIMRVTIPNKIKSIDNRAFYECNKLVEVINKSSINITKGSSKNGYVAYHAKQVISDKSQTRLSTDNDGFVTYNDGTDIWLVNYVGDDTEITIPNYITKLSGHAFYNCRALTSVVIGNELTLIGSYAFYNCSSLKQVIIGENVTSIGQLAFAYCSSLNNVVIPNSVTYLGDSVFKYCDNLLNVTIGNGVTIIDIYTFYECNSLTSVIMPNSVTEIGKSSFEFCNLKKVYYEGTLPYSNTIKSVGSYNTSLTNATWYYFTSNGANETNNGNWFYYDNEGKIVELVI